MAKPVRAVAMEKEITDIAALHELIRTQTVSPVEVVNACLKRIEQINPKLNAFITVLADLAREQASIAEREIRAGKWRGPLHGIPLGIKDFYDTAGIRTTAAFEYFKARSSKTWTCSCCQRRQPVFQQSKRWAPTVWPCLRRIRSLPIIMVFLP